MDETKLITRYADIKSKIDSLKKEQDEIREQIGYFLHKKKVNEIILTDSYGVDWKPQYQNSKRKKVDYDLLLYEVGQKRYNEIISINEITALVIRKAPKRKKTEVTSNAPKEIKEDIMKNVPKGKIK